MTYSEWDLVAAGDAGSPREKPRRWIQRRPSGQEIARVSNLPAIRVSPAELDANGVVFTHRLAGNWRQRGRETSGRDEQCGLRADLLCTVAGGEADYVGSG